VTQKNNGQADTSSKLHFQLRKNRTEKKHYRQLVRATSNFGTKGGLRNSWATACILLLLKKGIFGVKARKI
jgi:hypothetical protein